MSEKTRSPGPVRRFFSKSFRRKAPILYLVTALLCVMSFFLPGIVLGIRDRALAGSGDTVAVDEVQLSILPDLSAPRRLALVGDSAATAVPLSTGRNFTEADAEEAAGDIARDFSLLDKSASSFDLTLTPQLRVASDDSALITWTAVYTSDSRDVTIVFDDETGQCLAFRQISYPHGKDLAGGITVSGGYDSAGDDAESAATDTDTGAVYEPAAGAQPADAEDKQVYVVDPDDGQTIIDYFNDPHSMDGYDGLIARILVPLRVDWNQVSTNSPQSVSAIIPYDNTYYSMPVSIRTVEHEGLTYALHISVNM